MAVSASPPPTQPMSTEHEIMAEVENLSKRQKLLSSTLLSTTDIQDKLNQSSHNEDLEALINNTKQHSQTNVYRLAFGVTAFSFTDPSPETSDRPLLGIRFDICRRNGQFDTPYYILCKRVNDEGNDLQIHRHTIPALVPLQEYVEKYMTVSDEGYGSSDIAVNGDYSQQDLHGLVRKVRSDLVSWRLRQKAIELLRDKLGLPDKTEDNDAEAQDGDNDMVDNTEGSYGIRDISAVAVDAYYARIVWSNGRVGRIKIGDNGIIERAVVFGNINGQEERCKDVERLLTADKSTIEELIDRLKKLHEQMPLHQR